VCIHTYVDHRVRDLHAYVQQGDLGSRSRREKEGCCGGSTRVWRHAPWTTNPVDPAPTCLARARPSPEGVNTHVHHQICNPKTERKPGSASAHAPGSPSRVSGRTRALPHARCGPPPPPHPPPATMTHTGSEPRRLTAAHATHRRRSGPSALSGGGGGVSREARWGSRGPGGICGLVLVH
jgi:hypothetical protein